MLGLNDFLIVIIYPSLFIHYAWFLEAQH